MMYYSKCLKIKIFSPIVFLSVPMFCMTAGAIDLKSETDKVNYSVGYQIGEDFKKQGISYKPEAVLQGIQDAIDKKPLLSREEMDSVLVNLKKKILADEKAAVKKAAAEKYKADEAFLEKNAKVKDVTVLPSGVQYKVLKQGTGKKPAKNDEVRIHYRISRIDGKELASTYVGGKPRIYQLSKAMPGLQDVLLLMNEGSKLQVVLPPTATGARDAMDDAGVLIYDMELISIIPAK